MRNTSQRRILFVLLVLALFALSLSAWDQAQNAVSLGAVQAQEPPVDDGTNEPITEAPDSTESVAETEIVVRSGADPDTSATTRCSDVATSQCTLRRAIVQANAASPGAREVAILFDIPKTDGSYDNALDAWVIKPQAGTGTAVFPALVGGQIFIDASSQESSGEREFEQVIILVGPGSGDKDGIVIGASNSGADDSNAVIGIAFQNFRNHVVINSSENELESNWFGLTSDGKGVALRGGKPANGSGAVGVKLADGVTDNIVANNLFVGFAAAAIAASGQENYIEENSIGMNAQSEVPGAQAQTISGCGTGDWLGGGGITVAGTGNYIFGNILAGLRQQNSDASQPDAINVTGKNHEVLDNFIGMDEGMDAVGVCGRGISLTGGPTGVLVASNTIFNSGRSAISLNGSSYNANDLSGDISYGLTGNLISQASAWTGGETAVQLGASLPAALRNFRPAAISEISGKIVKGTNGTDSKCGGCKIEIFLDDRDNVAEAQQSLAILLAGPDGSWQFNMTRPLTQEEGLRTMSTTTTANIIPGMGAGTSTGLSELYAPAQNVINLYLPLLRSD